jgi:cytochrome P450
MQHTLTASNEARSSAGFYPPRVRPAARPLRFPSNLIKLLNNNLEIIPEQAYREPVVFSPGPPRMAFFTDAELVKLLLLTRQPEFPKGRVQNETLRPLFGEAMISAEGREWRWQRAVAAPLFRNEELLQFGPIMTASAEATVETWRTDSPGAIRLINKDMMRAAYRVISSTMLAGGAEDVLHQIEKGHTDYFHNVNWWAVYVFLGLPDWLPRPGRQAMRAHERRVRTTIAELVASRRGAAEKGQDLLARLLRASDPEAGQSMPDELVVNNILSFLVAGYDTTALAMTWTLYLISQSPEWEGAMLEEVKAVVGSGPVTSAHFAGLLVVQQVLNESLRLYPTAPLIARDIATDTDLNGLHIPAGTIGMIPIYAIHRHRSYWDDPDRFDPSRFGPGNPRKPTRYQFMPFGAGARICLGAAFAMMEATIMLATFVRAARFQVEPGFDPQPVGRMFLVPRNGMPMRVMLRESSA